jgi:quercetin dioxygenase-like cupin family protein
MQRCLLLVFAALLLAAQTASQVEITSEPHHHLTFENEYVRVFNVEVAPKTDTLMHWHRHDYAYVTLGASHISNEVQGKAPVEVRLPDGETRFSPAPFAHVAKNLSEQPFRNVTIEYLQDEKLREAVQAGGVKWDEERGLDVLQGGTKQILFVSDGVRVTAFELQPGGIVPRHYHTGPHLLIAVTDMEIRSDVDGQGPMPGHFKSGDSKWLPGGYSHSVTNVGRQPAKFVTLEFP